MDPSERYRGCMLGLAVGDAIGTTLEVRWLDLLVMRAEIAAMAESLGAARPDR